MITVENSSGKAITVAINTWGDGDTSDFRLENGTERSWDRRNQRGFVMALNRGGASKSYYVLFDSTVVVLPDDVTRDNRVIYPLNEIALT